MHQLPQIRIAWHPGLDSTNTFLERLEHDKGLPEGLIIAAHHQYKGKGQNGSIWESEPGKNLTFSLLLKPISLQPARLYLLSFAMALGQADYLASILKESRMLTVKWPNDIYMGDQKIAGLLIKNAVIGEQIRHCIVGIGLNVNQVEFPAACPNPTSLARETGRVFDLTEMLPEIADRLMIRYGQLLSGEYELLRSDYLGRLYRRGLEMHYRIRGIELRARITGIDDFGRLKMKDPGGCDYICDVKELEYL